ncbi:hypothetical protein EVAR_27195_1 [Eumeta japonica]|uniref:Uncharacterized protein n=1 Tax=Eumeta variegata TaxID=151549 RepID=A0A4C1VWV8_EUMVA|nr:hypothetical protein EVAR_27195_1 [Eumeta japonica]
MAYQQINDGASTPAPGPEAIRVDYVVPKALGTTLGSRAVCDFRQHMSKIQNNLAHQSRPEPGPKAQPGLKSNVGATPAS